MRRQLPPMNALLAFEAAARHRNFTRAAEELSVAQPAVTRHIANIENWIGTPLFTRRGSNVRLTAEGQRVSELATSTLDRLELGLRQVQRSGSDELVVGASFGVAHLWVMPRISAMRAVSGKNINLVTADDYRTFDGPSVDFSIRFGNGEFHGMLADRLFHERCQIVASPSFLEAHPEIDPDDILGTTSPGLLLDHGDPWGVGWMDWERWFAEIGRPYPGRSALRQVQSYPTMLDMVCAGEGISIGTHGVEDDLVRAGKMVLLGDTVSRPNFGYYLVYQEAMQANTAFQKLRAHLVAELKNGVVAISPFAAVEE